MNMDISREPQTEDDSKSVLSNWFWGDAEGDGDVLTNVDGCACEKGNPITGSHKTFEREPGEEFHRTIIVTYLKSEDEKTLTTERSKQRTNDDFDVEGFDFRHMNNCSQYSLAQVFDASCGGCDYGNAPKAHVFQLHGKIPDDAPEGGIAKLRLKVGRFVGFLNFYKDVANKTVKVKVKSCAAHASFTLNGNSASSITIDNSDPLIMDGSQSTCASGYFVSVQLSDGNWGRFGPEAMRWLTPAEVSTIDHFDVREFAAANGVSMGPNKYYRVKLAVAQPWNESTKLIFINPVHFVGEVHETFSKEG
jgi:hypothetical protein